MVYHPESPHAQSLFLFPIVFGINLIHFFVGKNNIGLGRIWSFVLGFRSLVARLVPFQRGGTKREKKFLAMESVNSLRISAPQWWPLREGRDGKCEGRDEKCEFLARESVNSSPIVRIFGKGKCKFIANFSATMRRHFRLSLFLSLSLSLSLSHRKYLTHNIGSASALPIIQRAASYAKGTLEVTTNREQSILTPNKIYGDNSKKKNKKKKGKNSN